MKKFLFFPLLLFVVPLIAQIDLEEGLVGFYPFNQNADDESENNNDATLIDGVLLVEGCDGTPNSAYLFDGSNDFIEIPDNPFINPASGIAFALSFWIKAPVFQLNVEGTVNDIISKWSNQSAVPYPFAVRIYNQSSETEGRIVVTRFDTHNAGCDNIPVVTSTFPINDDTWHHVLYQGDEQGLLSLYVDGLLQEQVEDFTVCDIQNNFNLVLGRRTNSSQFRSFRGVLDEIRFYDRILTEAEIDFISNKLTSSTFYPSLNDEINIFPNPNPGYELFINHPAEVEIDQILLINSLGQLVTQQSFSTSVRLPELAKGYYRVGLLHLDNKISYHSLVIK